MFSTFIKTQDGLYVCGKNNRYQLGLSHNNDVDIFTKIDIPLVSRIEYGTKIGTLISTINGDVYATNKYIFIDNKLEPNNKFDKLEIPAVKSLDRFGNIIVFNTVDGVYINIYRIPRKIYIPYQYDEIKNIYSNGRICIIDTYNIMFIYTGKKLYKLDVPTAVEVCMGEYTTLINTVNGLYVLTNYSRIITRIDVPRVTKIYYVGINKEIIHTINGVYIRGFNLIFNFTKLDIPEVLNVEYDECDTIFYTVNGVYVFGYNLSNKFICGIKGEIIKIPTYIDLPTINKIYTQHRFVVFDTIDGIYIRGKFGDQYVNNKINLPPIIQIKCKRAYIIFDTEEGLYIKGELNNKYIDLVFNEYHVDLIIDKTHYIIIHTSNGYYAIGNNKYGQLGLGHNNDVGMFTKIPNFDHIPFMDRRSSMLKSARNI